MVGIAVCSLNQLALEFGKNCEHIVKSIRESQERGASIRVGPELEICGYGCEDSFFEQDTTFHSWQVLAQIIKENFRDIIIDVGMPVLKDSSLYNCRVLLLNSRVLLIRPKTQLANNGNYRETRWFTAWADETGSHASTCWFKLPPFVSELTGQTWVPFGSDVVLQVESCCPGTLSEVSALRIGFEICEELWRANATHIKLFSERGCHVICNSSGSYWELRKLDRALALMRTASGKSGGIYAFANLVGCDGGRVCFYGRSLVVVNGEVVAKTTDKDSLFEEVEVALGHIDLNDVVSYRQQNGIKVQSHRGIGSNLLFDADRGYGVDHLPVLDPVAGSVTIVICNFKPVITRGISATLPPFALRPEEEIQMYGSLWLWDYLRKCPPMKGFIIPLSGGLDSSSVACLVYSMCHLLFSQAKKSASVAAQAQKLLGLDAERFEVDIKGPKDICSRVLRCCYLATRYSGKDSAERAQGLASLIGAQFLDFNFDHVYKEIHETAPNFSKNSTGEAVTLLQQNLQARLRMVFTYYFSGGDRLVLASGNVDEALVGYLTKYDCSSADLNPIGSISKQDLRRFVLFIEEVMFKAEKPTVIKSILMATPSAELTGEDQKDEDDLGLTYEELSIFGRLRRGEFGCFGPYGLFCKLWDNRENEMYLKEGFTRIQEPALLATKVKRFFTLHARNRHKQTILTPSLHSETYSPDDNRFDHRQYLFDSQWKWQFQQIDQRVVLLSKPTF